MADEILGFNDLVPLLINSPASSDHYSDNAADPTALGKRLVTPNALFGSVEFHWTGLDQSDGTITVQCSSTGDSNSYITKASATTILAAGSGVNSFSLNGVITERYYRVAYLKGTNTTGAVSAWIYAKTHGV